MADRQDVAPLSPEEIEAARSFHAVTYSNVELGRSAFEVDALIARLLATIADRDAKIEHVAIKLGKLIADRDSTIEGLREYAQHPSDCLRGSRCSCGLSALLGEK